MNSSLSRKIVSPRYYYMDALRASALLLGVFFHIAESFCPERYSWAIVDSQAHWGFGFFQHTLHSFRMELFFLISGFFAHLLLQKRGLDGLIVNRTKRIAVPMIVFWILLFPIVMTIWIWGAGVSGSLDNFGIPMEFHDMAPWKLTIGMLMDWPALTGAFSMVHLWFLYYLVLVCVIVVAMVGLGRALPNGSRKLIAGVDKFFEKAVRSKFNVLIFALGVLPCLLLMKSWTVDTPNSSLVPETGPLLLYGYCFGMGWFLHRDSNLMKHVGKHWGRCLIAGLALAIVTENFSATLGLVGLESMPEWISRFVYACTYAETMVFFMFGFIGLFQRMFSSESRLWRYLSDSSYWIYLIHIPIIAAMDVLVANWEVNALLKYAVECVVVFSILFASYHLFARSTFIGRFLNGRKYPFALFRRSGEEMVVVSARRATFDVVDLER